jgi:hypothetical protein
MASTDGRVGRTRLVEIKCPQMCLYNERKHVHGIPFYYLLQIHGQMALSGIPECDFVALCPATQQCRVMRVQFNNDLWQWVWPKLILFRHWLSQRRFPASRKRFQWDNPPPVSQVQVRPAPIDTQRILTVFRQLVSTCVPPLPAEVRQSATGQQQQQTRYSQRGRGSDSERDGDTGGDPVADEETYLNW